MKQYSGTIHQRIEGATLEPGAQLIVHSEQPLNAETPLDLLHEPITPVEHMFLRNNFAAPLCAAGDWQLTIDGLVRRPLTISYDELMAMPMSSYIAVLECSGNGRSAFAAAGQPAEGVQWGYGAVANAEWIGVPVALLLEQAGVKPTALQAECVSAGPEPLVRGVEVAKLQEDAMLAIAINGELLPAIHGGPVRLVVPGWGGISWVKWISQMTLISRESRSPFNQESYVLYDADGQASGKVRELQVKSLLIDPQDGAALPAGRHRLSGFAWSAGHGIASVEVSVDDQGWQPAQLLDDMGPRAWRPFVWEWQASPGQHRLAVRATDRRGNTQPARASYNRRGYLMNAVQRITVTVMS